MARGGAGIRVKRQRQQKLLASDWRIVDYIPWTGNMVATRSQGHIQFVTGDSKSGKYSTIPSYGILPARGVVGGKFSVRTTI